MQKRINFIVIFALLSFLSCSEAWQVSKGSQSPSSRTPKSPQQDALSKIRRSSVVVGSLMTGFLSAQAISNFNQARTGKDEFTAHAVQGAIKSSSAAESKAAAELVKRCLAATTEMEGLAAKGDYEKIATLLSNKDFQGFENAATILVRSDALTADEKVALGTIKRYGVVADAIIMLGGLSGELKSGGFSVGAPAGGLQQAIEDSEEEQEPEEEEKKVNGPEVRKYVKLSKDALNDIYKIVAPILNN